jgi:hypothetical protein
LIRIRIRAVLTVLERLQLAFNSQHITAISKRHLVRPATARKSAGKLQVVAGGRPTEWERIISDFEASAQASGLSFRTVEHYSDVLRRVLLGYCTRNEIEPQALTKRDLKRPSRPSYSRPAGPGSP